MILPLIARQAARSVPSTDRYSAWTAAFRRFREDWALGALISPLAIPAYLVAVPEEQREDAFADLVGEHLSLAWRRGRGPRLEDYLPGRSAASLPARLIEREFLARHESPATDVPRIEEYRRRFDGRPDVIRRLETRMAPEGRFVRLRRLGAGGGGEVWAARDLVMDRIVALKGPSPARWTDPEVRRRFASEVRMTSGLSHPGIIAVHEVCEPDDAPPFLVLPWIQGCTLAERIHGDPKERGDLLAVLLDICGALSYAHAHGVVHRDLKPGNVLLGERGQVLLIDWGLAGAPTRDASPEARVGTPEYMPPERLAGAADVRGDVFGLGGILYEILTGRSPRSWGAAGRPADWTRRVREEPIVPPRRLRSGVPKRLETLCLLALDPDPNRRPATSDDFATSLAAALPASSERSAPRSPSGWLGALAAALRIFS